MIRRLVEGVREVRIADCVHFCAFPYGRGAFNPYENYIQGLARGADEALLYREFVDFLAHYRPRHLGEALGVVTSEPVPLWLLPWKSWRKLKRLYGWQDHAADVLDVMTGFSNEGIPLHLVEAERAWLRGAWESISANGYRPREHSYINVMELKSATGSRFLVLDGNHRISALSALGHTHVSVRHYPWQTASLSRVPLWPLVLTGHVSRQDATSVFLAYFSGNEHTYRSDKPAPFVDTFRNARSPS